MDIMSPRPVIKSTEPYSMIALGVTDSRAPSRRQMTSIPEKDGRRSKRIHDLADDLDSTGLRAVMEREQRRREKKSDADAEKLKKRLERRAEKQRAEEDGDEGATNTFTDPTSAEAQATPGTSRTRSKRRNKQHRRRRSSSATRDIPYQKPKDQRAPPVPPKPDAGATKSGLDSTAAAAPQLLTDTDYHTASSGEPTTQPNFPPRTDSKSAPLDIQADRDELFDHRPSSIDDRAIITPDRIVPEEDPDDAEPPVIARSRHPASELPHVEHLYKRQAPPSPIRTNEPTLDLEDVEPLTPFAPLDSPSANEPVLDFAAIEPPAIFAPVEADARQNEPSTPMGKDLSRISPLLTNDGEEIPGLPFLSSVGSDSDSPIVSPFAASFPTHFSDGEFAAPAPTVHRDPLLAREARYSSLSPTRRDNQYGSSSSITALPQVPTPTKALPDVEKPKRKRGPSLLFSFFRRGEKRNSRARSASDTAAGDRVDSGVILSPGFQHDSTRLRSAGNHDSTHTGLPVSPFSSRLSSPRGQSRFKEDLAGLNIQVQKQNRPPSPPQSRVNSPYSQIAPSSPEYTRGALPTPISQHRISEQSYSGHQLDYRRRSQSLNRVPNPPSKSMASIDSEGSWLTGKPLARGLSNRSAKLRNLGNDLDRTATSALPLPRHQRKASGYSSTSEGVPEPLMSDDHFGLRPASASHQRYTENDNNSVAANYSDDRSLDTGHMASSEIIARSITHDGQEGFDGPARLSRDISVRKPEVKTGVRVKSSEGLFKNFLATPADADDGSPKEKEVSIYEDASYDNTPIEKDQAEVFRAMSVRAPKRNSGAKLVELSKASSTEATRNITQ